MRWTALAEVSSPDSKPQIWVGAGGPRVLQGTVSARSRVGLRKSAEERLESGPRTHSPASRASSTESESENRTDVLGDAARTRGPDPSSGGERRTLLPRGSPRQFRDSGPAAAPHPALWGALCRFSSRLRCLIRTDVPPTDRTSPTPPPHPAAPRGSSRPWPPPPVTSVTFCHTAASQPPSIHNWILSPAPGRLSRWQAPEEVSAPASALPRSRLWGHPRGHTRLSLCRFSHRLLGSGRGLKVVGPVSGSTLCPGSACLPLPLPCTHSLSNT